MENESQNEGSLQEQEINSQNSEELPEEKNKNSKIEEKDNESIVSKSVVSNNKELIVLNPDETVNDVISQFVKIKNCSVILYGIKPSTEKLKFGYCRTCDIN